MNSPHLNAAGPVRPKSDNPIRHFIVAFVIALIAYAIFYQFIEHRRTRKGPWQVTFSNSSGSAPAISINQPNLGITNVEIVFPGQSILPANATANSPAHSINNLQSPITLIFRQPRLVPYEVPFGKCIFMDTTFLPGTLTFNLFGHEIELLPRVIVLDHEEHAWSPGTTINLASRQPAPAK